MSASLTNNSTRIVVSTKKINAQAIFTNQRESDNPSLIHTNVLGLLLQIPKEFGSGTTRLKPNPPDSKIFHRHNIESIFTIHKHIPKATDEFIYEFAMRIVLSWHDDEKQSYLSSLLKKCISLPEATMKDIDNRVIALNSTSVLLNTLKKQEDSISSHSYYRSESFSSQDEYNVWKIEELKRIADLRAGITPVMKTKSNDEQISHKLIVEVLEITGIPPKKQDVSLVFSLGKQEKKMILNKEESNVSFSFDVYKDKMPDSMKVKISGSKSLLASSKSYKGIVNIAPLLSSKDNFKEWVKLTSTKEFSPKVLIRIVPIKYTYYEDLVIPCTYNVLLSELSLKIAYHYWTTVCEEEDALPFSISQHSLDLIEEFALRYGIHKNFQKIITSEVLMSYCNTKRDLSSLCSLAKFFFDEKNLVTYTIDEKKKVNELQGHLKDFFYSCFLHSTSAFSGDRPKGAFEEVVNILKLFEKDHQGIIEKALNHAIEIRYSQDIKTGLLNGKLPSNELIKLIDQMIEHVDHFSLFFDKQLPKPLIGSNFLVKSYLSRLGEDATVYFSKAKDDDRKQVFSLFHRFLYLFSIWKTYEPNIENIIPIHNYVEKHLDIWIDEIFEKIVMWASRISEVDDFKPLTEDAFHSFSIVDLFSISHQALDLLIPIFTKINRPNVYNLLNKFSHHIGKVSVIYCARLESSFNSEIKDYVYGSSRKSSLFFLFVKVSKVEKEKELFKATEKLCVIINNIETCRKLLHDFSQRIFDLYTSIEAPMPKKEVKRDREEFIDNVFRMYFKDVKGILDSLIYLMTEELHPFVEDQLYYILRIKKDKKGILVNEINNVFKRESLSNESLATQMTDFFEYMNEQLDLLVNTLYMAPFRMIITSIWNKIISCLYKIIIPVKDRHMLHETQIDLLLKTHMYLSDFFSADGLGIASDTLDSTICTQQLVARCTQKKTAELIFLVEMTSKKPRSTENDTLTYYITKLLRLRSKSKKDKQAKKFLKNM